MFVHFYTYTNDSDEDWKWLKSVKRIHACIVPACICEYVSVFKQINYYIYQPFVTSAGIKYVNMKWMYVNAYEEVCVVKMLRALSELASLTTEWENI